MYMYMYVCMYVCIAVRHMMHMRIPSIMYIAIDTPAMCVLVVMSF